MAVVYRLFYAHTFWTFSIRTSQLATFDDQKRWHSYVDGRIIFTSH